MKLALGGSVAVILLDLYVYSVWFGIVVVNCVSRKCGTYTAASFTTGMVQVLTLVGGLVSALVIAELAVTPPSKAPLARALDSNRKFRSQNRGNLMNARRLPRILAHLVPM